jgi:hypothetical protein
MKKNKLKKKVVQKSASKKTKKVKAKVTPKKQTKKAKPVAKKQEVKKKPVAVVSTPTKPVRRKRLPAPLEHVDAPKEIEAIFQVLLKKSGGRGFVTEAEILHAFPDMEDNIPGLEQVFSMLDKRGIEIVDQEVSSIWEQKAKMEQEEKGGKGTLPISRKYI